MLAASLCLSVWQKKGNASPSKSWLTHLSLSSDLSTHQLFDVVAIVVLFWTRVVKMSGNMSPLGETTTPDDDLFFSSPGLHSTQRDPQDEVQELVDKTRNMAGFSPALNSFMALHKAAFLEMFNRQLQLIRSRSQAFEDAHITVFDKVLLELTQNGTDLDNPAAIQYYCEEYLGINTGASCEETSRVLHQTMDVPKLLTRGNSPFPRPRSRGFVLV